MLNWQCLLLKRLETINATILDKINGTSGPPLSQFQNGALLLLRSFIIALGGGGGGWGIIAPSYSVQDCSYLRSFFLVTRFLVCAVRAIKPGDVKRYLLLCHKLCPCHQPSSREKWLNVTFSWKKEDKSADVLRCISMFGCTYRFYSWQCTFFIW